MSHQLCVTTCSKKLTYFLSPTVFFVFFQEVKAHWNVLVSCPYFQSLYDSGLDEKLSGIKYVIL